MSPAWQRTTIPNQFDKFWQINEPNWHSYKIREYHVSSIGNDHSDLTKNLHSGPDLLETFFNYVNKKERNANSRGNLNMGTILHKQQQKIYRKNHPFAVDEFSLQKILFNPRTNRTIKITGSIDLPEQIELTLENSPNDKIIHNICDVKSASEYTLPKNKEDKNITYFTQAYIYAYWLSTYYLNPKYNKIGKVWIMYIDKHNCGTYAVEEDYDEDKALQIWQNYIQRVFKLDYHLSLYQKIKNKYNLGKLSKERYIELLHKSMPTHEPHKWTKYSIYLPRILNGVFDEKYSPELTDEDLVSKFEEMTQKHAYWNGKETKGFKDWKTNLGY